MRIALIQTALIWEKPKSNRDKIEEIINSVLEKTDLIVLPEMFSTGFSMRPSRIAESMHGETIVWMKNIAVKSSVAICGSIVIKESEQYFNRLIFILPSGEIRHYDKRHLFTLAGENSIYTAGKDRLIIDYMGFKICPLICYDLRFPVFSRNTEDFDLLIYVANWPKPRMNAWDILLKARAVENMCYVIGVNRIGSDQNGHEYIGHSQAVDFLGNTLINAEENDGVFTINLEKESLIETREKLAFLDDRDEFEIEY